MKKNSALFTTNTLAEWEAHDGVNFAIALARITGWILHVDWTTPTDENERVENMKPIRVYVGNNSYAVYDFTGIYTIESFKNDIVFPLIHKDKSNYLGVVTRYYSEDKLKTLPLKVSPNEDKIILAQDCINSNIKFLSQIEKRCYPNVPAHIAAKFTFGICNPFACALCDIMGYRPVALIIFKFNSLFEMSKPGYAHSFVLDKDGNAIDIWGMDTIENIAHRFGAIEYSIDEAHHYRVSQNLKSNSLEKFDKYYEESIRIIHNYFIK